MAGDVVPLMKQVLGNTNGSLGETSALACIIGGVYLCLRRTASWEIPAGVLLAVAAIGGAINLAHTGAHWTVLSDLAGGALLFGAFFIATDPVSSPVTPKGKWIFGIGVGIFIMIIRTLSGYPEGVMFSVLLMNMIVPLINRWTVPTPVGGAVPQPKSA
jgi:electron transport complex protein RnfD